MFMLSIGSVVSDIFSGIEGFFSDTGEKIEDFVQSIFGNIIYFFKDILGGYIYNFIVSIGDMTFGFFTPNNINSFDFSKLVLFAFGIAMFGIVHKILSLFKR